MTNETQKAVAVKTPATQNTIKSLLEGDDFKLAIAKALPKHLHPDRFIRIALTAMTRTPKLAQCDKQSFFNALLTLSQFGLEPDGRHAHLIPFENRKRGCTECQLIIDYKGLVDLAMRSGVLSNIHADVVCDEDEFVYDRGQLAKHTINFRKPRGSAYAVYALARFKDGSEKVEVMTRDEVEAVRDRSRAANAGPWQTDWREMAKKTVFRRLSKWLPLSAEFRDAVEADADQLEDKKFEVAKPVFAPSTPLFAESIPVQQIQAPVEFDDNVPMDEPQVEHKPEPTSQETLQSLVTGAGYTFDDFHAFAIDTGIVPDIDSASTFGELSKASADRCLKAQTGMMAQLAAKKGVAK